MYLRRGGPTCAPPVARTSSLLAENVVSAERRIRMTVSGEAMVMTSETPVLRVTVANEVEAFEALRDEWLALLAEVPRATAFQTPEWLATWWRMCGTNRQIWLLVVRRADGALIGLMPLQLQTLGPGRWGLRVLRWL